MYVSVHVLYVCMHVSMYVCMYVCLYVCMYVFFYNLHVCLSVDLYVCMFPFVCECVWLGVGLGWLECTDGEMKVSLGESMSPRAASVERCNAVYGALPPSCNLTPMKELVSPLRSTLHILVCGL